MKSSEKMLVRAPSKQFLAMLRRIQNRVITYGVVTDREDEFLRQHTDHFDNSREKSYNK